MSFARVHLGLSADEFLDMTPRYFSALVEQNRYKVQHLDAMLAQIAAAVINFSPRGPKRPVSVPDLMPGHKVKRRRVKHNRSAEEIADEARRVFDKAFGF